ncbi:MAG TPA: DUF2796 domain-containing protein [Ramlibacter sp.]|nr:DUF2796 domain-containing protein [Ramlibacter sp.]
MHGAAEMSVTIEGSQLTIELDTPLENLAGFEHAPRTEKQRAAVRAMAARLREPQSLFVPTPAASCTPGAVRLSSAVLPGELLGETATASPGEAAKGHADLEAAFVFRCANIGALQGLETSLLKTFRGIHKLKVQVAGPRGQSATVLEKGRTSVRW